MNRAVDSIDSELAKLGARRAEALDLIIRCFVEIVGIDNRVEALLDRRFAATSASMIAR